MARATKSDQILIEALPEDEQVRAEYDRLIALFKKAPKEQLSLARKLISRVAFLSVMIDRLELDITTYGYEEEYQNGANQSGKKKSAAAELHVSYTKNLMAVMKQLNDMLVPKDNIEAGDEFDKF